MLNEVNEFQVQNSHLRLLYLYNLPVTSVVLC